MIIPKKLDLNPKFVQAFNLMDQADKHIFVTGKAGTGKSTLLTYFREKTQKNIAVLAPTGVAAVNIKGQTIHSFFRFRPDITVEKIRSKKVRPRKKKIYQKLEAIVIDEISMVRADLMDCIDAFMQLYGPVPGQPFGGAQLIMIGDLYQLPPVVTSNEKMIFSIHYPSPYFFDSLIMSEIDWSIIELTKVYRQQDENFIRLLNAVRNKNLNQADLDQFNRRYLPDFSPDPASFYIYLTTTNRKASEVNQVHLAKLSSQTHSFTGSMTGQFEHKNLPAPLELEIKPDSQVMLVNNDRAGRWINGTVGQISRIRKTDDQDYHTIYVQLDSGEQVEVTPYTWEMYRFFFDPDTNRVDSETIGTYTQYPIILAWAITIHKSQGKTFERVVIDLERGSFAHGQTYVALSRCTSLDGLVLKKRLVAKHVLTDWRVSKFLSQRQHDKANQQLSPAKKKKIIEQAKKAGQDIEMVYLKANDTKSTRIVTPIDLGQMHYMDKKFIGLAGYCHSRQADRVFRIDRILELKPVERKTIRG